MHGRDIQGPGQRLGGRHGAMELEVEILRGESVQVHRRILEQGPGKDGPFLQGGAVQERLQDASRASRGRGDVHFRPGPDALRRGVSHVGDRFPGPDVQDDGREVRDAAQGQFVRPARRRILHLPLEVLVDACARFHALRLPGDILPGQVGKRVRRLRKRFIQRPFQGGCVDEPPGMQPLQKPVPFLQQPVPALARVDGGRGVGENGEHGGFRPGQFFRRPSEIAPGSGVQPYDIPSERSMGSVQGQDLILGPAGFQPGSQERFHPFLPKCPFLSPRHPYDLHRDGAAPAYDVSFAEVAPERPDEREGIHARMPPEMAVLELDQGRGIPGRNRIAGREAPLTVGCDPGSQQFALPVGDDRRIGRALEKVPRQAAEPECEKDLKKNQQDGLPAAHRVTEAVPDAVWAATCGLYMAEQVTEGRTKDPS